MKKTAQSFHSQSKLRLFSRGMTLIELLVTLFLAILMIAIGLPGFLTLRQGQEQGAAMNQIYGLMQFARSLAMTDATTVTFCASTNQVSCTNDTNFANGGVILAEDQNGDNVLVRVVDPIKAKDFVVALNGFPSNSSIEFTDVGEIGDLATTASITFCDPRGTKDGAALIVNPLGMVRIASDDDDDQVVNIHTTDNILCNG